MKRGGGAAGASPSTGSCVDDDTLALVFDAECDAATRARVAAHCDGCEQCQALVAGCARVATTGAEATTGGALSSTDERFLGEAARLLGGIDARLPRGARLGRYVVHGCAGEGAMGIVYEAYDPELDRRVALKLLRRDTDRASGAATSRLLREARAHAKLTHPNVVAIYDVGTLDDRVFLALEFVDGWTLSEWLGARPRSTGEILAVFVAAGRGLSCAHEAGLVHRDFKPENVLVPRHGPPKVTDFGLARGPLGEGGAAEPSGVPRGTERLTRTGTRLGTPAYMAPEQHEGRGADARSDQFSFCVALYEALVGRHPFARDGVDLAQAVIAGEIAATPGASRVPTALRRALRRGLARRPGERYPSMDALLRDLEGARTARRRAAAGPLVAGALVVPLLVWGSVALRGASDPAAVRASAPFAAAPFAARRAPLAEASPPPASTASDRAAATGPGVRPPARRHDARPTRPTASPAAPGPSTTSAARPEPADPLESYR